MNKEDQSLSWFAKQYDIENTLPVAQVRQQLLSLYDKPALFETADGFQAVDGNQTRFMLDLLFDITLMDDTWSVWADDFLADKVPHCERILNNTSQSLWSRLQSVNRFLNLPEGYPMVFALGYSAARFVERLDDMAIKPDEPEVVLRVYRYTVSYNADKEGATISMLQREQQEALNPALLNALRESARHSASSQKWDLGSVSDLTDKDAFCQSVEKAKSHIEAGDIYQIQLARRAVSSAMIPPLSLYEKLVTVNPAPYMYYLDLGDLHVISSSPELMVRCENGISQVRPIAGTKKRDDQTNSPPLDQIPKEMAEHLMLVDLARNDLARCAVKGSVSVPSLMAINAYGSLDHLVSTVDAPIRKGCDIWDVIAANFPAGTMTGAPKVRAMELINTFETGARGLFTGCAGYITGINSAVLALNIRTIIGNPGHYLLQAAAGVVADSEPLSEWEEASAKIRSFARAMGAEQ